MFNRVILGTTAGSSGDELRDVVPAEQKFVGMDEPVWSAKALVSPVVRHFEEMWRESSRSQGIKTGCKLVQPFVQMGNAGRLMMECAFQAAVYRLA